MSVRVLSQYRLNFKNLLKNRHSTTPKSDQTKYLS